MPHRRIPSPQGFVVCLGPLIWTQSLSSSLRCVTVSPVFAAICRRHSVNALTGGGVGAGAVGVDVDVVVGVLTTAAADDGEVDVEVEVEVFVDLCFVGVVAVPELTPGVCDVALGPVVPPLLPPQPPISATVATSATPARSRLAPTLAAYRPG
jgi:hypothetical protein